MDDLKITIKLQLAELLKEKRDRIDDLRASIDAEMTVKAAMHGGAVAEIGRNACEKRAEESRNEIEKVQKEIEWPMYIADKYF